MRIRSVLRWRDAVVVALSGLVLFVSASAGQLPQSPTSTPTLLAPMNAEGRRMSDRQSFVPNRRSDFGRQPGGGTFAGTLAGAATGWLLGGLAGGGVGFMIDSENPDDSWLGPPAVGTGAIIGATLGAGLGAQIGSNGKGSLWAGLAGSVAGLGASALVASLFDSSLGDVMVVVPAVQITTTTVANWLFRR
jgi:hypothetical protein